MSASPRCQVIGAGLPRTGTNSLEEALAILGYKTHHMKTLGSDKTICDKWYDLIVDGKPADWQGLFKDFDACVDNPSCAYWKELAVEFPESKVVLTVRKAEGWAKSYLTLQAFLAKLEWITAPFAYFGIKRFSRFLRVCAGNKRNFWCPPTYKIPNFPSEIPNPSTAELVSFYGSWVEKVQKTCPNAKERLLTFDVRDGWEPLCTFLNKPVPNVPFPNSNAGTSGLFTVWYENMIKEPIRRMLGLTTKY